MNTPAEMREALARMEEQIAAACRRANRARSEVQLMAVSKMHPVAAITEAAALGITLFGENKVQEYAGKQPQVEPVLAGKHIAVHLIGHLQGNKAAKAVALFDGIDTVDSVRLAERLDEAAGQRGRTLPVLIEIKLSPEESKSGLLPHSPELEALLERLPDLRHLHARGLMTVPPYLRDGEAVRPYFRQLGELRDTLSRQHPRLTLQTLSMGMTHDFPVAIEEGATEIRIGTAIFGARNYKE